MTEIPKCPTCGRLPSEAESLGACGKASALHRFDRCKGELHNQADLWTVWGPRLADALLLIANQALIAAEEGSSMGYLKMHKAAIDALGEVLEAQP